MNKVSDFFSRFWKLFGEKHVFFNASAVTFYLIVSSIPFALIVTSILGFVLNDEQAMIQVTRFMEDFLPSFFLDSQQGSTNLQEQINSFLNPIVERRRVYGLLGFGILTLTSLGLFATVKHVLFDIFDIEDEKHFFKELVYELFAFGIAGGVFIFFSVIVSLASLITTDTLSIPFLKIDIHLGTIYEISSYFVPIIFNIMLFYVFFRFVSRRHIGIMTCLFGAAVYTLLFELARLVFGVYIDQAFLRYQYLYQGYTILLMLGLWAFYGAFTFTLSAVAARAFSDTTNFKIDEDPQKFAL